MNRSEVSSNQGRLEIYHAGDWGTVCSDRFTVEAARVACAQMGLLGGMVMQQGQYKTGAGPIHMDEVVCHGRESQLWRCNFDGWGNHDCNHERDVGVHCGIPPGSGPPGPMGPPGPPGIAPRGAAGYF